MLSREDKQIKLERFCAALAEAEAVIIAENQGLTVNDFNRLRRQLAEADASAQVVKNTLANIAFKQDKKFEALSDSLSGPLIYGVSRDPANLAKIFTETAKNNPKFIVRGGAMPHQPALSTQALTALAQLPSREALLAQLAATMQAPVSSFVRLLAEVPTAFVRGVGAVRAAKDNA